MMNIGYLNTTAWMKGFALAVVTLALASGAQANIYVDVPGIEGDSLDKDHQNQIVAISTGGTFTQGRCGKYVITKRLDKATHALIGAAVSGQFFTEIVVEQTVSFIDTGRVAQSTVTLNNAKITRVETNMDAEEPVVEILKIKPQSIDLTFYDHDARGQLRSTFTESVNCTK